jgi:phosphohistidine swiveling domain-containing protein
VTIHVADQPLGMPILLAPMAGITDLPFRRLVAGFGAGLVVSEMIASRELVHAGRGTRDRARTDGSGAEAVQIAGMGKPVILVRIETSPEDIQGMHAAKAIVTARGGMTSHAAVVARGMGRPCVCGAGELRIDAASTTLDLSCAPHLAALPRSSPARARASTLGPRQRRAYPLTRALAGSDLARRRAPRP